jgi:hypothetical protein
MLMKPIYFARELSMSMPADCHDDFAAGGARDTQGSPALAEPAGKIAACTVSYRKNRFSIDDVALPRQSPPP